MVVHTQRCQYCSSERVRNILVRKAGESDKVFVQCLDCESFVASYVISPLGYYHHGKGYESFLRGIHRSGEFMSGRNVQRLFEDRKEQDLEEFQEVLATLQRKRKED
ncbi:MAG: hypothetical protein GVY26_21270 [Bacteroidetes bacterium]|jgi:hypothetical protein|nr:hypothetical protein [Bacteroidota bacterium]